jgi:hypothetical protein
MNRKCTSLKSGEEVVFNIYSDIYKRKIPESGSVSFVNKNRKEVMVSWLEGYKNRNDIIPFEDMLAVYNPDGMYMTFDNISGNSYLLIPE